MSSPNEAHKALKTLLEVNDPRKGMSLTNLVGSIIIPLDLPLSICFSKSAFTDELSRPPVSAIHCSISLLSMLACVNEVSIQP